MSWEEIEDLQAQHNNSLCGMYRPKQLKHWGQEPPKRSFSLKPTVAISSILLALGQVTTTEAQAQIVWKKQEVADSTAIQHEAVEGVQTLSEGIVIEGKVITETEDGTILPLYGAAVYLKTLEEGALSDENGNYRIEVRGDRKTIQRDTLVIKYFSYQTKEIPLSDFKRKPAVVYMDLKYHNLSTFYLENPSIWQRIGWTIRGWFRL